MPTGRHIVRWRSRIHSPEEIMTATTITVIAFIVITFVLFIAVEMHARRQTREMEARKQRQRDAA
jgi:large-conductance mechanosensitive channel